MNEPLTVQEAPASYQVMLDTPLKQGYKQTEVGVIPKDWEVITLLGLAEKKKELFDDGDWIESEHITNQGVRLIQTGNIGIGHFIEKDTKKYIYESSFISLRCKELKLGDLLVCRLADPAGRACVLVEIGEEKIVTSVDVTIFRPPSDRANRVFLANLFSTPKWFRAVSDRSGGTTHKRISRGALGLIPIPLPPLPEQRAIATALSDVDALLAAQDKLIAKKRDIKHAAMQQLLTGKQRLPGFQVKPGNKQTEIGMIPEDWSVQKIRDIAVVGRGRVISHREISAAIHSAYPVFSSQTSNNGAMGYIDTYDFEGEYITWTTDGENAGTVFYRNGRFNCTNVCGTIQLRKHNALFVSKVLGTLTTRYVSRNLANPKLMNDAVKQILVPLPLTLEEQTAIATVLSDMDADLTALEQQRDKTRALKQGMMQELLTGRIRLV